MKTTLKENIMNYITQFPGATDTEMEKYFKTRHQSINQACRKLEKEGCLVRKDNPEKSNHIGNYPLDKAYVRKRVVTAKKESDLEGKKPLQEDEIKVVLNDYLIKNGWDTKVAWGHKHGIDIEAVKDNKRWVIEVKGPGSRQEMRVNYFIMILGETLQRMTDSNARYSIALPDIEQFRRLWERLPQLAKERTTIDIIFVDEDGNISFLD